MNAFEAYRDILLQSGLTAADAERVVSVRADKRRPVQAGTIRMEKSDDETAEVLLYDVIGFDFWSGGGITPKGLVDSLAAMKPFNKLTVRINSPGGDVFDGMTLFNILRRQDATVSVEIEGLAASAASFIAMVADAGELRISEAGMAMVHNAWGVSVGNKHDMLELADLLDKIDGQIATMYANRSKRKAETWLKMMDAETWLTGQEAVAEKFADDVVPAKRVAALYGAGAVSQYRNAPADIAARLAEIAQTETPRECHAASRDAVNVRLRVLELDGVL